jgi:hypothetical protein
MVSEEINLMATKNEESHLLTNKKATGHSNEPEPKSLSKTPIKVESNTSN